MDCSSLTTFTMGGENYDSWRNSAVAYIMLQALQSSWHLVIYRICKLSSFRERYLGYWFYVNQRVLGRCNVHHDCLREVRCLINHIFGSLYCFSYIQTTHFQDFPLTTWSVYPRSYLCMSQPPRHEALFWWFFLTTSLGLRLACLSSCALLVSQLILSGQVLWRLWVLHDAVTVILDAGDYLHHHGTVHRDLVYACFPLSHLTSLHLFERLENIRYHSNDLDNDIVIVDIGMQVHFPPVTSLCWSLHREKLLYPPDEKLTSLARSSIYAVREVIKNTGHQKLVHTFDRFDTHTWTKHKFIVISLHSHHHLRSPLRLSFDAENTTPSRTRTQNQISESVLEPVSNQAEPFIWRLAVLDSLHHPIAQEALCDPWFAPTTQSYADFFLILRQNWGPRTISATLLLLRVAWACKVVVNGSIKIWIYASSRKCCRRGGWHWSRQHWFRWACSSRTACLDRGGRKTRWFLMLLHVKWNVYLLSYHTLKNTIIGGWVGYKIGLK